MENLIRGGANVANHAESSIEVSSRQAIEDLSHANREVLNLSTQQSPSTAVLSIH